MVYTSPFTNVVTYDPADFQPASIDANIMPPDIMSASDPWDDVTIVKRPILPPEVASTCYLCARRGPRLYVSPNGVTLCENCGDELRDEQPKPR